MLLMRGASLLLCACLFLGWCPEARPQASDPSALQSKSPSGPISKDDADAETQLQRALSDAGNDRAALVRNLRTYLLRFPDSPRKAGVYRALVEACQQLRDAVCALEYSEKLIAIHPDDSEMMLLAVNLLEERADDASLTRASGYISRVLDRIEKTPPEEKPARASAAEWRQHHDQVRSSLYYLRGEIEKSRRNYDAAEGDLQKSYSLLANAAAAELLGEIAEMRNDTATAIDDYTLAFVLPQTPPATLDRRVLRMKLGNVWRRVYGTENGLGAQILATYDRLAAPAGPDSSVRNKDAKDLLAFTLRRIDGSTTSLASLKGKVIALSFWATWCGPCRELEPLFNQVAMNFGGDANVAFFSINTDEDESLVVPFVSREHWDVPVFFADGLDEFMKVTTLPTVLIVDPAGKIVYRTGGLAEGFPASLTIAVRAALSAAK
jgi:thiol-disulfide isomerase/thioredoxin